MFAKFINEVVWHGESENEEQYVPGSPRKSTLETENYVNLSDLTTKKCARLMIEKQIVFFGYNWKNY